MFIESLMDTLNYEEFLGQMINRNTDFKIYQIKQAFEEFKRIDIYKGNIFLLPKILIKINTLILV